MRSAVPRKQTNAFSHEEFSRILSGCPKGAGKRRISIFAMLLHRKTGRRKVPRPAARQRMPRSISGRLSTQWHERMKFSPAPGAGQTAPLGHSIAPFIISAGSRLHPFTPLHQYCKIIIADFFRPVNRRGALGRVFFLFILGLLFRRKSATLQSMYKPETQVGAGGLPRRLPIQKSGGAAPRGGRCAELLTGGTRSACTILCGPPAVCHRPAAACPCRSSAISKQKRGVFHD